MKDLIVNVTNLNMREQPNSTSEILGKFNKNEVVSIVKFNENYEWVKVKRGNGVECWASFKYLLSLPDTELINPYEVMPNDFKFLKIAFGEIGIAELPDPIENQRIVQYLSSCDKSLAGINENSDETDWCSAFVNWCVEKAGYAGTNYAWALSWKNWEKEAETGKRGALAVFERYVFENGVRQTRGHVGFFLGEDPNDIQRILILGGNQSNKVCVKSYPKNNENYKFLGLRVPS